MLKNRDTTSQKSLGCHQTGQVELTESKLIPSKSGGYLEKVVKQDWTVEIAEVE